MAFIMRFKRMVQKGFSLIEMMFVIVIIGVITTLAVSALRDRIGDQTVNRTASEAELILQSLSTYYSDYNKKPSTLSELIKTNYLTFQSYKNDNLYNPWGYTYTLDPDAPINQQMIKIPTPNNATAQKLAALLPSSGVSGRIVTTGIPASVSLTKKTSYSIFWPNSKHRDTSSPSNAYFDIAKLDCPSGFTSKISTRLDVAPMEYDSTLGHYLTYWVTPIFENYQWGVKNDGTPTAGQAPGMYAVANFHTRVSKGSGNTDRIKIVYEIDNMTSRQEGEHTYYYPRGHGHDMHQGIDTFGSDKSEGHGKVFNSKIYDINQIPSGGDEQVLIGPNVATNIYGSYKGYTYLCATAKDPRILLYCANYPKDMSHGYIGELHISQWCSKK